MQFALVCCLGRGSTDYNKSEQTQEISSWVSGQMVLKTSTQKRCYLRDGDDLRAEF